MTLTCRPGFRRYFGEEWLYTPFYQLSSLLNAVYFFKRHNLKSCLLQIHVLGIGRFSDLKPFLIQIRNEVEVSGASFGWFRLSYIFGICNVTKRTSQWVYCKSFVVFFLLVENSEFTRNIYVIGFVNLINIRRHVSGECLLGIGTVLNICRC